MEIPGFNRATHLSIVWGVTLAVLTLIEWRSLDRDPIGQQILTPFIEREISVDVARDTAQPEIDFGADAQADDDPQNGLQYTVETVQTSSASSKMAKPIPPHFNPV